MSYRAEKVKQMRKVRRWKRLLLLFLVAVIASLCVFTTFYPAASWKYYFSLPSVEKRQEGELRIHFLEVGQGDCTLVEFPDGKTMLVDGGSPYAKNVDYVLRYLNALKIKRLDFLVVTGNASNRSGSLTEIAAYKEIGHVYFPTTDTKASEEYSAFLGAVGRKSIPSTTAKRYVELGSETNEGYRVVFLLPHSSAAGSSALWIEWKGYGTLLCGDMTEAEEQQLFLDDMLGYFSAQGIRLSEQTSLLRMANFGKATAYTQTFLEYLCPENTVISCLASGAFSPDEWTIPSTSTVYRTDRFGTVVASITETGLTVKTAK